MEQFYLNDEIKSNFECIFQISIYAYLFFKIKKYNKKTKLLQENRWVNKVFLIFIKIQKHCKKNHERNRKV